MSDEIQLGIIPEGAVGIWPHTGYFQTKARAYRSERELNLPGDLEASSSVLLEAFYSGISKLGTGKSGEIGRKLTSQAIELGLKQREDLFRESNVYLSYLEDNNSVKDVQHFLVDDLGFSEEELVLLNQTRDNFFRTRDVTSLRTFIEERQDREKALEFITLQIVSAETGVPPQMEFMPVALHDKHLQANILRGFIFSSILASQGHNPSYRGLYISDEDIDYATKLAAEQKGFIESAKTTVLSLMNRVFDKGPYGLREIFEAYVDKVGSDIEQWEVISKSFIEGDIRKSYWGWKEQFFIDYPINPVIKKKRHTIDIENLANAIDEERSHIWENAIEIDEYIIPSFDDFARALWIYPRSSDQHGRVMNGFKAWKRYRSVQQNTATNVEKLDSKISELEEFLENYSYPTDDVNGEDKRLKRNLELAALARLRERHINAMIFEKNARSLLDGRNSEGIIDIDFFRSYINLKIQEIESSQVHAKRRNDAALVKLGKESLLDPFLQVWVDSFSTTPTLEQQLEYLGSLQEDLVSNPKQGLPADFLKTFSNDPNGMIIMTENYFRRILRNTPERKVVSRILPLLLFIRDQKLKRGVVDQDLSSLSDLISPIIEKRILHLREFINSLAIENQNEELARLEKLRREVIDDETMTLEIAKAGLSDDFFEELMAMVPSVEALANIEEAHEQIEQLSRIVKLKNAVTFRRSERIVSIDGLEEMEKMEDKRLKNLITNREEKQRIYKQFPFLEIQGMITREDYQKFLKVLLEAKTNSLIPWEYLEGKSLARLIKVIESRFYIMDAHRTAEDIDALYKESILMLDFEDDYNNAMKKESRVIRLKMQRAARIDLYDRNNEILLQELKKLGFAIPKEEASFLQQK